MNDRSGRAVIATICLTIIFCGFDRRAVADSPHQADASYSTEPRIFAEGIISTGDDEFGGAITPDGKTIFFDKTVPRSYIYTICVSHFENGRWSQPEVAPFSGYYRDSDPVLSPDGLRLYFVSDRPVDGKPKTDFDVWVVEKIDDVWRMPKHLDAPINSEGSEYFASETKDGTIYFTSNRAGSRGGIDVYRSKPVNGKYAEPENLGDLINSPSYVNIEALVAPDESYLLIGAFGHADGYGDCDIFISYNRGGSWTKPENLGPKINTAAREYTPRISPDGKYFFFTSERGLPTATRTKPITYQELESGIKSTLNGLGNIYQIDMAALGIGQGGATGKR